MRTKRISFATPQPIENLLKIYTNNTTFLADSSRYPLCKGIIVEGSFSKAIQVTIVPHNVTPKVDSLLSMYETDLLRKWNTHIEELISRLTRRTFTKAEEEAEKDDSVKKAIIAAVFLALGDSLVNTAQKYYEQAYLLGRKRGISITKEEFTREISDLENKQIKGLLDKNSGYLDNFMNDMVTKYTEEVRKEFPDEVAMQEALNKLGVKSISRLTMYAGAALGALALGFANVFKAFDEFEEESPVQGIIWITQHDEDVCRGCEDNDGTFFTLDEFVEEYQSNDCLVRCRCAESSQPTEEAPENFGRSEKMMYKDLFKGGPGSGCQGPNCGRPSTGGSEEFNVKTKYPNAFKMDTKNPIFSRYSSGEFIDKYVVLENGDFVPVMRDQRHGVAIGGTWETFDTSTRVIQDIPRKLAFIRLGGKDKDTLMQATMGDERAMNQVLSSQRDIADKLYGKVKGMTIVLGSGGTWRFHNNNLPRELDNGEDIPDRPEKFVDKKFIYRT